MSDRSGSGVRWRRSGGWAAWVVGLAVIGGVLVAACSAAAVPRASGPFVYVADTKRDEISQFRASRSPHGALKPLAPATVPAGLFPYTIAVDPQGTSAYATSSASRVYQYTLNPTTGRLRPKSPATVASKSGGTAAIAFTPNGKSAYFVESNHISQYSINATTGDLTPKSPATVVTPPNAEPIAVSPNGGYAYVANCGGCGYARQKSTFHRSAGPAAAKRPAAKPSYLAEYRINPRTGALSSKPTAKVRTGNGANWIAVAPRGKSVYVATSTGVWQYTTNPRTGKVFPKSPESAGPAEHNIVIAANGKNAYVIGDTRRGVCQYHINPRTGALNSKPVSTAPTVLHPEALALSAEGNNAYVTSENDGKVAQYKINPTTGKIKAMTPATVRTPSGSLGLAVTP